MLTTSGVKAPCVFKRWGPVEKYKKGKNRSRDPEILFYNTKHRTERESQLERITDRPWAALGSSESDTAASHTQETSRYAIILFLRQTKHRNKQIKKSPPSMSSTVWLSNKGAQIHRINASWKRNFGLNKERVKASTLLKKGFWYIAESLVFGVAESVFLFPWGEYDFPGKFMGRGECKQNCGNWEDCKKGSERVKGCEIKWHNSGY